jgi:competence protein ComEC
VPLALLAAVTSVLWPALATPCLAFAERVHDLAWPALSAVANMPLALWQGSATPTWYAASAVALLVLRLPGPSLWRATALLVALPLAAGRGSGVGSNDVQLSILDAGSGVAVLVRTARHALVYDTGEIWGSEGGAVTRDLAPLLRTQGLRHLDMLVLSRADAFQVVGAAQLLSLFEIGVGYTGGTWRSAPAPIEPCPRQRRWRWDGVEFELMAAPPLALAGDFAARAGSSARGSCVLRVEVGRNSVLIAPSLTEYETEAWAERGATRPATVLIAPQRRVAAGWRSDVTGEWIVASRRRTTHAERARLGAWYGLAPAAVLATDRTGPLRLDLSANGAMRWSSMLDRVRVPIWRVPREAPPDWTFPAAGSGIIRPVIRH